MDNRFWFSMKRLSLLAALAACLASADHTGTGTSPGSGTGSGSGSGSAPPPYDASVACSEAIGSNMECVLNLRFSLGEYHVPGATTVAQCKAQTIGMGCDMMQHGASPSVRSSELLPRSLIVHSPLSRALSLSLSLSLAPPAPSRCRPGKRREPFAMLLSVLQWPSVVFRLRGSAVVHLPAFRIVIRVDGRNHPKPYANPGVRSPRMHKYVPERANLHALRRHVYGISRVHGLRRFRCQLPRNHADHDVRSAPEPVRVAEWVLRQSGRHSTALWAVALHRLTDCDLNDSYARAGVFGVLRCLRWWRRVRVFNHYDGMYRASQQCDPGRGGRHRGRLLLPAFRLRFISRAGSRIGIGVVNARWACGDTDDCSLRRDFRTDDGHIRSDAQNLHLCYSPARL